MSYFQVATLTKQQKDIVDEILKQFPSNSLIYHCNVEIPFNNENPLTNTPHKKKIKQTRLLVVSKFRLFIFVKDKTLEKDYPILFLEEISGVGNTVNFKFSPPKESSQELIIKTDEPIELVHFVRQCYRQFTFGWPDDILCKENYPSLIPFGYDFDPGPANGFIQTYLAYCNFTGSPPRSDLIAYVTDLFDEGITDLDLTSCPGIDPKSENPLDLIPIAHALKFNTYFRGLELRDIENKEAALALSIIMMSNRTLTRVVCVNCNSEISDMLGNALSQNTHHIIQIIQLSGNKFLPKAIEPFAKSLPFFTHDLKVLDLSNTGLVGTGLFQFFCVLNSNPSVSLRIHNLNISNNNPVTSESSAEFSTFVSNVREKGNLTRLSVANTGSLITGSSLLSLGFSKLKYLDVSDNKLAKMTLSSFLQFCEITRTLEVLRISNLGLSADVLGDILGIIADNESLGIISIDMSRNNIGPQGVYNLIPALKKEKLDTLDLTENNIKDKGGLEILKNIKYVRRLILDKNSFEGEQMASMLGRMANNHQELYSLSISENKFGKSIKALAVELQNNNSLEELDISYNNCGDNAFIELCSAIRINSIKILNSDANSISYSGYLALKNAISSKSRFRYLQFPLIDFEQDQRHKQKFMDIYMDISMNKRFHHKKQNISNLFEFDMKWQTPGNPRSLRRANNEPSQMYTHSSSDDSRSKGSGSHKIERVSRTKLHRKSKEDLPTRKLL